MVKNKHLKASSRKWIERHINDPYVKQAQKMGYRSRAAFKILEIEEKYKIFNKNTTVIDLGSAPGGWSQVIAPICKHVIAVDLLNMSPINNVTFIKGNFLDEKCIYEIKNILKNSKINVIMSDMAPNTCGIHSVDHLRIINLIENLYEFAKQVLSVDGIIIAKFFQGGLSNELLNQFKKSFNKISNYKPKSSRKDSTEMYLIAQKYKYN